MKCPHCGQEHPDGFQFCPVTGKQISLLKACINESCINFGKHILPPDAKFCPECGSSLINSSKDKIANGTDNNVLEFTVGDVTFNLIRVEHGSFIMGDNNDHSNVERKVNLTNNYYIGETLVTMKLWEEVMRESSLWDPHHVLDLNGLREKTCPITYVSWSQSQEFIDKLNFITGKSFRLPTEAEWEFAARGGIKSQGYRYSGSDNLDDIAWYFNNSNEKIHPVAKLAPNELGIYDMCGNVYEFCQDVMTLYFLKNEEYTNPAGDEIGDERVVRGCAHFTEPDVFSLCNRFSIHPDIAKSFVGFRLALSE